MDSCCQSSTKTTTPTQCPACHQKGKGIQLITLKALLQPEALETIHPESAYAFCTNPFCEVVYFSNEQTFGKDMLKVSVFQKDEALDVPVCYCFGWTRERLITAVQVNQNPIVHIREQVQANRCGCEVNNPQGACCLGNVTTFIRSLDKR
ncbi:(2Fe-2S)-binding protein [Paenibacillus sp. NPDC056722]|uniref:putative iron-sulfur cluster-binding metallochaperone n=1 Tax=Paenibacillus sp. NPDC056722 TaxID=3345924 RepID=UPI003692C679